MNSNLKKRFERLEQVAGASGCDDPRVYSYPNTLAEAIITSQMTDQQLEEYLRKRSNRPSAETCGRFDEIFKQLKATKNNNQTAESRAA